MKLKKFNEMWDPMGSWSPKHPDNQSTEKNPVIDEPKEEENSVKEDPEYLKKLPTNPEELTTALDAGLDPTTGHNLLLRVCFRDNLKESFNILADRIKEFNYGDYKEAKLHLLKHTSQYGRIEFLNKFYQIGLFDELSDSDWEDLFTWLKISRQLDNTEKEKVKNFLLGIQKSKRTK
jgi:hypothetical protein